MDTERILIILLSSVLIVLLALFIVLTIYVIKVVKRIHSVADAAEEAANNIAEASEIVRKAATPTAIANVVGKLVKTFSGTSKKKGKK